MYHSCSFLKFSYRNFTFVSFHLVANFVNFNFVNYLFLGSRRHLFFSNALLKSIVNVHINESPRKILEKNSYLPQSPMSFNMSADGPVSSSSDEPPGPDIENLRKFESVYEINEFSSTSNGRPVKLKIMNYNVLSQELLLKHRYLYRRQKDYMLRWDYRKERIEKDIIMVDPDILCLQEVEEGELPYFYKHLEKLGYKSAIKMKTRNRGDGLAIFYRHPNVTLKEKHSVEFSQPGVIELESRDNVGLIAQLEKGGKDFFVANTHLLYNPKRTEVRLAQLQIFLAELHRVTRTHKKSRILLMGDFNSNPESFVIKFLMDGQLQSQYKPLPSFLGISPGSVHLENEIKLYNSINNSQIKVIERYSIKPEPAENPDGLRHKISHPLNFSSVYDLRPNEKRGVTTYQDGWIMVDYIFYEKGFNLLSRLTLPTSSECHEKVHFLPNTFFPSDHLPLAAEFEII